MNLWIGNGAVLQSSNGNQKNFENKKIHGRNYPIFKILLNAIDWNF